MKKDKRKKWKELLKKTAESKGFYIALLSLIMIIGVYVYAGNMKKNMEKEFVAFDDHAWQEALDESDIEVVDIDEAVFSDNAPIQSEPVKESSAPVQKTKTAVVYEKTANLQTEQEEAVPTNAEPKNSLSMSMPCDGKVVAECSVDELVFCSTTKDWRTHNGIDIATEEGTSVKAAEKGVVSKVFEDEEMGIVVTVEHTGGITTVYSNLESLDFISAGKQVKKGDIIGSVGKPGTLEADMEPHLHFEVLSKGEYQNPVNYIGN